MTQGLVNSLLTVKVELMSEEQDETASKAQQKTRKFCDDEVDVNGESAGKKNMIVLGPTKQNVGSMKEKRREDSFQKLKQRKS